MTKKTLVGLYYQHEKEADSIIKAIGSKEELDEKGIDFDSVKSFGFLALFVSKPKGIGFENHWFKVKFKE